MVGEVRKEPVSVIGDKALPLNKVVCGDCFDVMRSFPSDSIDLVVTSPPYWGLRDYGKETVRIWGDESDCVHDFSIKGSLPRKRSKKDVVDKDSKQATYRDNSSVYEASEIISDFCVKCGAWRGSLGFEPHPQMFIGHLVDVCRVIKRVLKPSGSFWFNLGDTYYGSGGKGSQYEKFNPDKGQPAHFKQNSKARSNWLQPKQLLGIPWRTAVALQEDGWILRNAIVWHKPNHMPSSVRDRLTNAYEHVFLLVKSRRGYYFDLDAIKKPYSTSTIQRITQPNVMNQPGGDKQRELRGEGGGNASRSADMVRSLIDNPRGKNPGDLWRVPTTPFPGGHFATFPPKLIEPIIKAGCPKGGVILDPFCGSGTALRVARVLGRKFIGIDISPQYVDISIQRIRTDNYHPPPENVKSLSKWMCSESG